MGDVGAALTDMWRSVLLFLPKAVAFAAIMAGGWLVASGARKVVDRALDRVGFDRAVQRGGVGRALERSRYDASDILSRLAHHALLLLTLQLGFGVWGPNPISDLIDGVVAWLPRAFVAIVIVVVAAAIASAVKDLVGGALGGLEYGRLAANAASWFLLGLGVIAALNQVGIATAVTTPVLVATLATVGGILVVGVGGGLVRPMARRWDRWLARAETEAQMIRERAGVPPTAPVAPVGPAGPAVPAVPVVPHPVERVAGAAEGIDEGFAFGFAHEGGHGYEGGCVHEGYVYESGHAAGGAIEDTQRIEIPARSVSGA